jgi:HEAT repeat protein
MARRPSDKGRFNPAAGVMAVGYVAVVLVWPAALSHAGPMRASSVERSADTAQSRREQTIREYVAQLPVDRLNRIATAKLKAMGDDAVPFLAEALADDDWKLRWTAADLLKSMGWEPVAIRDRAHYLVSLGRWDQIEDLGVIAIPALTRALGHMNWDRRMEAAQLLGRFGSQAEPAVPALIELARDINDRVRWRAVEALQRIGDERGFETWMRALGDEDARVRKVAVRALQDRPQQAVPALVERWKRLDDTRDRVEKGEIETLLCEGMNGPARSYLVERLQEILEGELDQQRSVNEAQQVLLPLLAPIDPALHEHWAEAFWWKVEFPVKLSAVVMFGTALLLLVLVVGRRVLGELRGHRQSAGDLERVA